MLQGQAKRDYQLAWCNARREAWIKSKGGLCAVCGSTEKLEVDHIDPTTKTMQPASIWSRRAEVAEAELAKCQVLCYTCHKDKSISEIKEKAGPITHGTQQGYARKCRCQDCKTAHSLSTIEYKKNPRKLHPTVGDGLRLENV